MEWKQAYDSGELENTVLITGRVSDLAAISAVHFFYTRKEASDAASIIGWPRKSARLISLPLGRQRWAISDDHNQVLTINGYARLLAESLQNV